jgi:hypothetical protein
MDAVGRMVRSFGPDAGANFVKGSLEARQRFV